MNDRLTQGFAAVATGDVSELEKLLSNGLSTHRRNDEGLTLLLLAAAAGRNNVVDTLLKAGADPEMTDGRGLTALMYASAKGHEAVVQSLIKAKAEPNHSSPKGLTALMFAAAEGHGLIVKTLLDHEASVHAVDHLGCSALHFAASAGHTAALRRLLHHGGDATLKNAEGKSVLDLAEASGFRDIIQLLGGTNDRPQSTPLAASKALNAFEDSSKDIKNLLNAFDQISQTIEIPTPQLLRVDDTIAASTAETTSVNPKIQAPEVEQPFVFLNLASQAESRKVLDTIIAFAKLNQERGARGMPKLQVALSAMFTGNKGSGKFTFANHYARVLRGVKVTTTAKVFRATRSDVVGDSKAQTLTLCANVCEHSRGGLLYIDKAGELFRDAEDQRGREGLDELLKRVNTSSGPSAIVFAGSSRELADLAVRYPNLKTAAPHQIPFADLSQEDLSILLQTKAESFAVTITPEAMAEALKRLSVRRKAKDYTNAKELDPLLSSALMQQSVRLSKLASQDLTEDRLKSLIYSDFTEDPLDDAHTAAHENSTASKSGAALAKLEGLIGLGAVKKELIDLMNFLQLQNIRMAGKPIELSSHMIFAGNPGTGKTTVARLMGDIYREIGLLPMGHLVETDRSDLVAGYLGQTALKTRERLDAANGGVYFVDEAYTLASDAYGRESIDTMLKYMEDNRGRFVAVLAGYTRNMEDFIATNPGLKSRFTKVIVFEDYSAEELKLIALSFLKANGFESSEGAMTKLLQMTEERRKNEPNFANAREVRNILEAAFKRHASRVLSLGDPKLLAKDLLNTIDEADIQ